jgi:hypothetical protein
MSIKAQNTARFTNDLASYARNARAARDTVQVVADYRSFNEPQSPIATYAVVVANSSYHWWLT